MQCPAAPGLADHMPQPVPMFKASLVDEYPPFSFSDLASPVLPTARATM